MSELPAELKYLPSHEWVRDNGDGTVTVGITDHAQELLGDLVFVELAEVGASVEASEDCAVCVLESVKAASDVYAPAAGEVIEANEALSETPELVNSAPYGDGWLYKLRLAEGASLDALLDAEGYAAKVAEEE